MALPQYTAQLSNRGESHLASSLSDFALVHKVAGSNDLGIDYFCEWTYGNEPTQTLFAIQVKTPEKELQEEVINDSSRLNRLKEVQLKINYGDSWRNYCPIEDKTITYWKGFNIPIYLFVLKQAGSSFIYYYKRFTPLLHFDKSQSAEKYYCATNDDSKFLAFADQNKGGFARDLFLDYIRCNYKQGSLAYKNPRKLGLAEFPEEDAIFREVVQEYESELKSTANKLRSLNLLNANQIGENSIDPSEHTGFTGVLTDSISASASPSPSPPTDDDSIDNSTQTL